MSQDLRPPSRGLLSSAMGAVQPVDADALLNALVDILAAQANLADALQIVVKHLHLTGDVAMQNETMDAAFKLYDVGESLKAATAAVRSLRAAVK